MSTDHEHHDFEVDKLILKLKIRLAADQDAIDPAVQNIMQIVRKMDCAAGKEYDIELALVEALANAVRRAPRPPMPTSFGDRHLGLTLRLKPTHGPA